MAGKNREEDLVGYNNKKIKKEVKKMPGFDGTGPSGFGPRTGGGFGFCPPGTGPAPGYYGNRGFFGVGRGGFPWGGGRGRAWGGGRRWGRGMGLGWSGYQPYPPVSNVPYNSPMPGYNPYYAGGSYQTSPTDELNYLRDHLSSLEEEMGGVRKRIDELESEGKKE